MRQLQTSCRIAAAFDPAAPPPHPPFHEFQAIWDTGATNSVITQRVVDACGLQPIGLTRVHGVDSDKESERYLVNVGLPNMVAVQGVNVTKGALPAGTFDVLIGMDIITIGDFAITNVGGETVFSFRFPSEKLIDFVEQHNVQARLEAKASRSGGITTVRNPRKPYGKASRHK